jgi:hypothetical protein
MEQRSLFVIVLMLSLVGNVKSQWVQSGTIPKVQVLAISPDGSSIIAFDGAGQGGGVFTFSNNDWTLTQSLGGLGSSIFLSNNGSIFASSVSSPNVDIFSSSLTSPGTWKVISTIYGNSLGLDKTTTLSPAAVSSDGKTLVLVSSKCYNNGTAFNCDKSIFLLQSDFVGYNYVLKQQLTKEFPEIYFYDIQYNRISMSADGSILAALWSSGYCYTSPSRQAPASVTIYSRGSDGIYVVSDQNIGDYSNWNDLTVSSNGHILNAAVCDDVQGERIQFYSQVDGQFQLLSISSIEGALTQGYGAIGPLLSTSVDSSVVFVCGFINQDESPVYENIILKQWNQTSWIQVENIVTASNSQVQLLIFSSSDGSTFVSNGVVYIGPPS